MKYILNTNTHKLHIEGYCKHISGASGLNYKTFKSENEARKEGGNAIGMCITCDREREAKLRESEMNSK